MAKEKVRALVLLAGIHCRLRKKDGSRKGDKQVCVEAARKTNRVRQAKKITYRFELKIRQKPIRDRRLESWMEFIGDIRR